MAIEPVIVGYIDIPYAINDDTRPNIEGNYMSEPNWNANKTVTGVIMEHEISNYDIHNLLSVIKADGKATDVVKPFLDFKLANDNVKFSEPYASQWIGFGVKNISDDYEKKPFIYIGTDNSNVHYTYKSDPTSTYGGGYMPNLEESREPKGYFVLYKDNNGNFKTCELVLENKLVSSWSQSIVIVSTAYINNGFELSTDTPEPPIGDDDLINRPSLPTFNVNETHFTNIYLTDSTQLGKLATQMWGTDFISGITKVLGDETPYECITSLRRLPYTNNMNYGSATAIKVGNISTTAAGYKLNNNFYDAYLGSVSIREKYNNYLDYAPFTTVEFILPFIGRVSVNTNIVMNHSVRVDYRIDALSGSIYAYLSRDENGSWNVFQTETGNCLMEVPLMSREGDAVMRNIIQAAQIGASIPSMHTVKVKGETTKEVIGRNIQTDLNVASTATGFDWSEQFRGYGSTAMNVGYLGWSSPVYMITRPIISSNGTGFSNIIGTKAKSEKVPIAALSGYFKVSDCNLSISGATDNEIQRIEALLKGGVIK